MRNYLDTVTNVATLATCLAIGVFLFQSRADRERAQPAAPYAKGERVTGIPEIKFQAAKQTLLLAIRKDCHYCDESIPFYKSLVNELAKGGSQSSVQLVVVTSDDIETARGFLHTNELPIANVMSLSRDKIRTLKIPGTPTLILTDQNGLVEGVWVGKLDQAGERDVLKQLG